MKGIILAGGLGTRLSPVTNAVSKQLLPVYDKPMVYYPLSVLISAGIREILLISTPYDLPSYKRLLGEGRQFGVHFQYAQQNAPNGLAEAFLIGKDFIGYDNVCLILGDNIFYGEGLNTLIKDALDKPNIAVGYNVKTLNDGLLVGTSGKALSIEEKPIYPKVIQQWLEYFYLIRY